jgi:hypothetical protein
MENVTYSSYPIFDTISTTYLDEKIIVIYEIK